MSVLEDNQPIISREENVMLYSVEIMYDDKIDDCRCTRTFSVNASDCFEAEDAINAAIAAQDVDAIYISVTEEEEG